MGKTEEELAMYYIGVDLGGTSMKVGLLNSSYEIIRHETAPTFSERAPEEIIKDMADLCHKVIEQEGITTADVHSVGIGCPGLASPKDGVILFASNLPFDNVNVREIMKKYIDLDIYVDNDANCATLGEAICGAAEGKENVVVVTLGTGIGGGIITGGKIYGGAFCGAGEVGHHVLVLNGLPCGCGRKGCWEQYASATALIRQAKEAATQNPTSALITMAKEQKIENINAKVVFDAAQAGDATAEAVLDQYFKYVAYGVTNVIYMLEPDAVVLGGGMSAQGENLTRPVTKYVAEEMAGGFPLRTEIKAAVLGNEAGIIGAALIGTRL